MKTKIKFRRGLKKNIPNLSHGEPAFVTDEKELYIGTQSGNVKLTSKAEVENIKTQLDKTIKFKIVGEGTIVPPLVKDGSSYTHPETHPASMITGLADIAKSGLYSDLTGIPTKLSEFTNDIFNKQTIFNELQTTNKTIIGAINELFSLIKNNGNSGNIGGSVTPPSTPPSMTGVRVEPSNLNLKVNQTAILTVSLDSNIPNKTIEYMSDNITIARVSDLGNYRYEIRAIEEGSTTIRFITADRKFGTSCSITVAASSSGGNIQGGGSGAVDNITNASETAITQQYSSTHEATPNNPKPPNGSYNWLSGPRINPDGSFPQSNWNAIGHWMTTYKAQGSNYYENVGLLLQNPKAWIWNTTTKSWDVLSEDFEFGTWYLEDFWDDGSGNIAGTTRWEVGQSANHSKWVKIKQTSETAGRCFHPWGYQKNWRSNSNWANGGQPYIVTKIDFKLIKWDENGVDNLNNAKLLVNSGADWWRDVGDRWQPDWSTNRDMAVGKYILATKELKRAWCTNLPQNWQNGLPE